MLHIECPWCGLRNEDEYRCGGESPRPRPKNPETLSDEEWAKYLYYRKNLRGVHVEKWVHNAGCQRWFNIVRNTSTHEILAVFKISEAPPKF